MVAGMSATIIDGKAVAQRVRAQTARDVAAFTERTGAPPGLATILVGDDPASAVYVGGKQKACQEVGITGFDHRPPGDIAQQELEALVREVEADPQVSGVLIQLPLPGHLDADAVTSLVRPEKDVDGLTAPNAGLLAQGRPGLRPCTPAGVIVLLDDAGVEIEGANAVVVGRSILVGRPMASLLIERSATVTVCHSRTRDLPGVCAAADILIAAIGRPEMITAEYVKPGAAVIDVGINRTDAGLVGDVEFEGACRRAAAITPVPGGVGPMTIAMLLRNTLQAAEMQAGG